MPFTVQGLEKIQAARLKLLKAMEPSGAFGRAVLYATTELFEGVQGRIHVDTGTYRAAQIPKVQGLVDQIYTGAYRNPKSGTAASVYGPYEEARGGSHAAYANTVRSDAPGVLGQAAKLVIEDLP
jgi:hypothetical protein